ncbi:MAG: hypothetical protein SOY73_14175, partial [Blautia sp.]|nr:hypothetical protein [Blautia sp.]
ALIGRLTHHVELILFPGINNRLRESSINATLSRISGQEAGKKLSKSRKNIKIFRAAMRR